jgi:farnesyl-diphosphate farnesyltransferase
MSLTKHAVRILERTSRTFYVPVMRLPDGLRDAVGAAYLCMRGIDEIEDHPALPPGEKVRLLGAVSRHFQAAESERDLDGFAALLSAHRAALPEVTLRLGEHAAMAPPEIGHRVWEATAAMADRMAYWASRDWLIRTEEDLNAYTYGVAGAIGLLLCDLWAWYDGTRSDRGGAVSFGRGLQAVNILRNRQEDLDRGVNYFPEGWGRREVEAYVLRHLDRADAYVAGLPRGPAREFCAIPLVLARGTLAAMARGAGKLARREVLELIGQATGGRGQASWTG